MLQENELITMVMGVCVLVLFVINRRRLGQIPQGTCYLTALAVMTCGWIATVIEGYIWEQTFNLIEHICLAISAMLVAIACWRSFFAKWESPE